MEHSDQAATPRPFAFNRSAGLGLACVLLLARLMTLGLYPLYDPSESRYAEMARKMLESGNWVTPMFDYGVPFWGKPPLTIWLTALSLGVGGVNDFSARLPSFLLSFGMAALVFRLGWQRDGKTAAWSAVLILASSVLFFVMAGAVAMDLGLSFGVTWALTAFWRAVRLGCKADGYWFFVALSIGVMAKGPIALVLSGFCVGLWVVLTGEWRACWRRMPWITGVVLFLVLCAPWFYLAERRTPGFLEYFFIGEHWKRFTEPGWKGDLYGVGRSQPLGMIWLYWLGGAFPWSLVLLRRLVLAARLSGLGFKFRAGDGWPLYCFLWMLTPLVFFTFSANLIWTYVLPGLPGMALLSASWRGRENMPSPWLVLPTPLAFAGLVFFYQFSGVDFFKSQKPLVQAFQQEAAADERLVYLKEKAFSAQFYLQGGVIELDGIQALRERLTPANHDYYVIRDVIARQLPLEMQNRLQPAAHYAQYTLFHASPLFNRPF